MLTQLLVGNMTKEDIIKKYEKNNAKNKLKSSGKNNQVFVFSFSTPLYNLFNFLILLVYFLKFFEGIWSSVHFILNRNYFILFSNNLFLIINKN